MVRDIPVRCGLSSLWRPRSRRLDWLCCVATFASPKPGGRMSTSEIQELGAESFLPRATSPWWRPSATECSPCKPDARSSPQRQWRFSAEDATVQSSTAKNDSGLERERHGTVYHSWLAAGRIEAHRRSVCAALPIC